MRTHITQQQALQAQPAQQRQPLVVARRPQQQQQPAAQQPAVPNGPLAIRIGQNTKPGKSNEFVGYLQEGPLRGRVTFFEGDVRGLKLGEIAFTPGVPERFLDKKFAFVEVIGGRTFGNSLDDSRAELARYLEEGRKDEEQREQQEAEAREEQMALWGQYSEVARKNGCDIGLLLREALEVDRDVVLPEESGIITKVVPPKRDHHEYALLSGNRFQVLVAIRDFVTSSDENDVRRGVDWRIVAARVGEGEAGKDTLVVAMTKSNYTGD